MDTDVLFSVGVVHLAVVEDSAGHVVSQTSSADVNEAAGLHWSVTAARHQHVGLRLPRLCTRVVALEQIQSWTSCQHNPPIQHYWLFSFSPNPRDALHKLTHFWPSGGVDLPFGGAGGQTVPRVRGSEFGVPAVLHHIIAVHPFDGEELRAAQDINHIVPEHRRGVPSLLEGAANVCPTVILKHKHRIRTFKIILCRLRLHKLKNTYLQKILVIILFIILFLYQLSSSIY